MAIGYHEISTEDLGEVKEAGIKGESSGDKTDEDIARTDEF